MANLKNTTINDTGFLFLPTGTSEQRPNSAEPGQIRYNTDKKIVEWYDSSLSAWFPTGFVPPSLIGGDQIQNVQIDESTYRIHAFTAPGQQNLTVSRGGVVDFLIVAGGGSGGAKLAGGGGAGGILSGSILLQSGNYKIVVGEGAPGQIAQTDLDYSESAHGGNSSAFGFTAFRGGIGGSHLGIDSQNIDTPGTNGGSGGGSGDGYTTSSDVCFPGSGVPGQGNTGGWFGAGTNGSRRFSGGGGGAGGPGYGLAPNEGNRSTGGIGIYLGHTFSDSFGESGYFGGGGGGFWYVADANLPADHDYSGGLGGGGDAAKNDANANSNQPQSGQANTGGGGGGSSWQNGADGGPGGSGIVIIRYRIS